MSPLSSYYDATAADLASLVAVWFLVAWFICSLIVLLASVSEPAKWNATKRRQLRFKRRHELTLACVATVAVVMALLQFGWLVMDHIR